MSNSIWHKYDIKDMPSLTREILARNGSHHNVCIINREDWERGFCDWIDRWTYITDIIAQADKAERLQKQLDSLKKYSDSLRHRVEKMLKKNKTLKNTASDYFMKSIELGVELEKMKSNN